MKKRLVSLLLVSALLVSSLTGCAILTGVQEETEETTESTDTEDSDVELEVLRVATMPFLCSVPIIYMEEYGIDEKYGFTIETIPFATGAPMNESIPADEWDVGAMSAAAVYALGTYEAYCVGYMTHAEGSMSIFVDPDSDIAQATGYNPSYPDLIGSAETVEGATIALPIGTLAQMHFEIYLEQIGLTSEDVNIVHMEYAAALQALQAGQVDMISVGDDVTAAAREDGFTEVSEMASSGVSIYDSVIATAKMVEENSDLLVRYLAALYECTDALMADPDLEAELLYEMYQENGSDVTLDACIAEVEARPLITSEEIMETSLGDSVVEIAEFFASQDLIDADKIPLIESLIDDSFVKEALGY